MYNLSTYQLVSYMLKDPYIRQHFGGVLAVNEVPVLLTPDKIYIVNGLPRGKKDQPTN